ncbi:DNA replication complex GINS protein SLD5-like [Cicer arietinum]|uniref:DNA replication complex GINS protein SLD5 n=1 Tax=Cicer arietinum TaxID=3827 RepID=A0A1S2XEK4_CICAR|nr:DNA replication complex GINS protein SLD5-like [Cicer arietinum]XP_012574381.1 DNA replication complex GINS protein SLD5-like [Cicer arietinum]
MGSRSVEGEQASLADDYDALISTTDVVLLKRAWRNEKAAPEILHFESDLITRVREQIELMEETVEEKSTVGTDPLSVSLYQMDLDRTLFLLRSYLRIRIQKIEKYMFHLRKTEELWNRLSKDEKFFTERCTDDFKKHLEESVLSKLPENYQSYERQSVISEEDDMVPEPRLDTFVLCRSKEYLTGIQLEDGPVDDRSKLFEMEPDVLYFICYKSIKPLVESGKIDLL